MSALSATTTAAPPIPPAPEGESAQARTERDGRRLAIGFAVTAGFMGVEVVGGIISGSSALLADAGHMLSDAAALALSYLAVRMALRPVTPRLSYGWARFEILAALANGIALVAIAAVIGWESVERMLAPKPVDVPVMMGIAAAGLVANLAAAWVLGGHGHAHGHDDGPPHEHEHEHGHAHGSGHDHHDHAPQERPEERLNVRAAYAHVLGDLLGSVGALVAGAIMWRTQWWLADPIVAAFVGLLVLRSGIRIVRQAATILLEAVPAHVDLRALEDALRGVEGVAGIHHLHVWTISSGVHLMSCHAVLAAGAGPEETLERLSALVRERFEIDHTTIQIEARDRSALETASAFCRGCEG